MKGLKFMEKLFYLMKERYKTRNHPRPQHRNQASLHIERQMRSDQLTSPTVFISYQAMCQKRLTVDFALRKFLKQKPTSL